MSIIKRMRRQTAILWTRGAPDRFGRYTFAEPIEIKCRWDDTTEEFVNPKGQKQIGRSVVYVDRVIAPGDRLKRGDLDSSAVDDPLDDTLAYEVQRVDQNPNLKATEFLITAYL